MSEAMRKYAKQLGWRSRETLLDYLKEMIAVLHKEPALKAALMTIRDSVEAGNKDFWGRTDNEEEDDADL